jgi:uncharacterized protein (DUF433 family)
MAPPTVNLNLGLLAPRRTAEQIRDEEKVSSAVSLYRRGLASLEAAARFADVPMACLLAAMPDGEAPRRSDEELGRDAQRYIAKDPGILSGIPCLKGSRVPAHLIADMVANGDSVREISAAYPYLTEGQVHAAVAYTRAFPRRARPVLEEPPWRKQQPIASSEVPLDELPLSP